MKYTKYTFEPFYHHFCSIKITDRNKKLLSGLPDEKDANGILVYGYCDKDYNDVLEVVATSLVVGEKIAFSDLPLDQKVVINFDEVAGCDFFFFGDKMGELSRRFKTKIADLEEEISLTKSDLKSGKILEESITNFKTVGGNKNLLEVSQLLRDSEFFILCTEGKAEVLSKDKENFLPIFTNAEAMGAYGNAFSKARKTMPEIIELARVHEKNVKGLVVNPFSNSFLVSRELMDAVEKMQSRLK